jgi:hypothetical protein
MTESVRESTEAIMRCVQDAQFMKCRDTARQGVDGIGCY